MPKHRSPLRLDQPAVYQIMVQGRLDPNWSAWFDDLTVTPDPNQDGLSVTTLSGRVVDQVALHALLIRIRDLGLPLLLVEWLGRPVTPDPAARGRIGNGR